MRALLWVLASVALLLAPAVAGASTQAMDGFVREVLEHNPSLRGQRHLVAAFRHEASAADLWPDPSVSVMLDNVPDRGGVPMPMIQYQVSQMVMWPGKLRLMRQMIERQGAGAAADVDVRRIELVLQAKSGFLMLAMNLYAREVNAANQALLDTITSAALARYSAGVGNHHEVARAQVERSVLEVERLNLDGERVAIVAMLNALRNRAPDVAVADPGGFESPPRRLSLTRLAEHAVRERPELKSMGAMREEMSTMAELARRERYPDWMVSGWYNQMLMGPDTAGVMIGVTLPVFGVTRQNRRARGADERAAGVAGEIEAMRAMIRAEVADALRKVDVAERTVELVREVVLPRAEQSFDSALAAYASGTADMVTVLDARRALQMAAWTLVESRVRRELSLAELERAVGGRLEASP